MIIASRISTASETNLNLLRYFAKFCFRVSVDVSKLPELDREIICSCAPRGFLGLSETATLKTLPKFEGIEYTRVIKSSLVTILF